MLGVLLVSIGTFFEEAADSIGKSKVQKKEESIYTLAFLSLFWGSIFFALIAYFRQNAFVFSSASLPTFLPRLLFEILQMHLTVLAIARADRSTYSFIRILTIPLLLLADFALGYHLTAFQFLGVSVIIIILLFVFLNKNISKYGAMFAVLSAINATVTISLYKYDIAHFNSVVAEQLIVYAVLLAYFFLFSLAIVKENPLLFLKKKIFMAQSLSDGIGGILESFAYSFGLASVILAGKRSSSVLWSVASGNIYFKEQHLFLRIFISAVVIGSLVLLAL